MTLAEIGQSNCSEAEKILERIEALKAERELTPRSTTTYYQLGKRINQLDELYRERRGAGRYLQREYGS